MFAAAGLAAASLVTFVIGITCLGLGLALSTSKTKSVSDATTTAPATTTDTETAQKKPGFFSKLGSIVSHVVPSSGGPDRAGFTNGHPVGLYFMTRYANHSLEKAVWYFTSSGQVYVDPTDGFSDDTLAAQKGPHGTTSDADGAKMTITWAAGTKEDSTIEKDSTGFAWDMGIFVPVERFSDDSGLIGRWEGGSSSSFNGNSAIVSRSLDIQPGGTFNSEGAATFRSESDESVTKVGGQGSSSGSWRLDGYILTLTYADGKVTRGIAFPYDDDKAHHFFFAGTMYKKE
jgi:hypothetical protein